MDDASEIELELAIELDRLSEAYADARRSDSGVTPESFAEAHPEVPRSQLLAVLRGAGLLSRSRQQRWGPFQPGDRVGPYEIVGERGRGGMGIVYEATETGLGRRVALKVLHGTDVDDRLRQRFAREARAAARLDHHAIVPVYGSGETDGVLWYAMRLVDGESLHGVLDALRSDRPDAVRRRALERLERVGSSASRSGSSVAASRLPLRARAAASVGARLAGALAYAHAEGILHRDVKPANVLVDEHGDALLTDFGLCRVEGDQSLTRDGDIVGTLRYMPPEALQGHFDHRGDVYGLGLVLYEFCAGRPAFEAESRQSMLHQVLHVEPPLLRRVSGDIPLDLERIVRKATSKLPDERYATAEELEDDLTALLAGKPVRARRPSPFYLLGLFVRRNRALAATLLAATVALVLATIVYVAQLQGAYGDVSDALALAEETAAEARITGAEATLRSGDISGARDLLGEVPEHHRDWVWRHLAARVGDGVAVAPIAIEDVAGMTSSPDGERLLMFGWGGMELRERRGLAVERTIDTGVVDAAFVDGGDTILHLERSPRALATVSVDGGDRREIAELPTRTSQMSPLEGTGFVLLLEGYNVLVGYDWKEGREVWRQSIGVPRISVFEPLTEADIVFGTTGGQLVRANANGGMAESIGGHLGRVTALLAEGGEVLASGASDGSLDLFPALTGHTRVRLMLDGEVTFIERSREEPHLLAVGLGSRAIALVDARTGVVDRALSGTTTTPIGAHFSADPWVVALATGGELARIESGRHDGRIELAPGVGNCYDIGASADGRWIASENSDGLGYIRDLQGGETHIIPGSSSGGTSRAVFASDGSFVVIGSRVIDLATMEQIVASTATLFVHSVLLPDGDVAFLSITEGALLRSRWTPGADDVRDCSGAPKAVGQSLLRALAHPMADRVFFGSDDGWLGALHGDELSVDWELDLEVELRDIALDPTGRELYAACHDGLVRVFDADSGALLEGRTWRAAPPYSRRSTLSSIVAGPGEGVVTTCTMDGRVEVWEAATARRVGALLSVGSEVRHLSVLGDGEWLVCGGGFGRTLLLGSGVAPVAPGFRSGRAMSLPAILEAAAPFESATSQLERAVKRSRRYRRTPWLDEALGALGAGAR